MTDSTNEVMTITDLAFAQSHRLDVMNYLNEVVERFPQAISFASGRPNEQFYDLEQITQGAGRFAQYLAQQQGKDVAEVAKRLCQYGRTSGIIQTLVSASLQKDENIAVASDNIVITNGAQEAMALCLSALFRPGKDVLLVTSPTYIGITGLAQIYGIDIAVVKSDEQGPCIADIKTKTAEIIARGQTPKALYVIPDFNNPVGSSMALERRQQLLDFCYRQQLLVIEDNPYGLFRYRGEALPTLKSLDSRAVVLYIGTFAKTLCPALRVGYLVVDQKVEIAGRPGALVDVMSQVKSLVSVNTSQLAQAMVGGLLLAHDCSLKAAIEPLRRSYGHNLELMVGELERVFAPLLADGSVRFNRPEGGFFLTIDLPFEFSGDDAMRCAEDFGVIVVPMAFFAFDDSHNHQVRLSFSYVDGAQISQGIEQFGGYVAERLSHQGAL